MTENPEASVLTARRAAQHFRLFRANDAYEHLCILTLLPSLAPLHLMLADTPWPRGFGATLTNVGPLSEGFERIRPAEHTIDEGREASLEIVRPVSASGSKLWV